MNFNQKTGFFLFFFLAFLLLFQFYSVSAQGLSSGDVVELRPSIVEPDQPIEPGGTYEHKVTVRNKSGKEETFYPVVENMRGISDSGSPLFTDERTDFGLSEWITIDQESITLGPDESADLNFTLKVPEEAGPQGYYGALFMSREAPRLRETGSGIEIKVGAILSFRVQGEAHEEALIREFYTGKNIYRSEEDVEFYLKVENLGNVLVRPRGTATIVNMFGDEVDQVPVNHPRPGGVFPESEKNFDFQWEPEDWKFGKFNVELDLVYGENSGVRTISDSVSFWILPINLIVGSFVGLLLFIVLVFFLVRFYIRKRLKEASGGKSIKRSALSAQSAPMSKLTLIAIATLLFTVLFALVVFFLFA
ncbi:MAG: hypothetical protein ACLFNR_00125 [Candidatus Paceibacterota bacterium]